jgi:hemerythrin superfamily protein
MSTKSNGNAANVNAGANAAKAGAGQDAIALLTADHREVSDMFEEFEGLSDRSRVSKKKLADKICKALIAHTTIEEEIFYPAVRQALKGKDDEADDMVDEAIVEHAAAKDLIKQILEMQPDEDLYDAKVKVLSEEVEHHVKEEEEEMFKEVREDTDLDLIALGQEMALRKQEILATL